MSVKTKASKLAFDLKRSRNTLVGLPIIIILFGLTGCVNLGPAPSMMNIDRYISDVDNENLVEENVTEEVK